MKTRNVKMSLFVLAALLVSSAAFFVVAQENSTTSNNVFLDSDQDGLTDEEEILYGTDPRNEDTDFDGYSDGSEVMSGYNPLKAAPGDKLETSESFKKESSLSVAENEADNLTQEIARKITDVAEESNSSGEPVDTDDVRLMVESALNGQDSEVQLKEISNEEIKIKKQNYSGLSKKKAEEKKKEDFTEYLVSVLYIMASNSPEPITSSNDVSSIMNQLIQQTTSAISSRNSASIEHLASSGEKIYDQLKEVEVPEELVDTHIKVLQYLDYSSELKTMVNANSTDPMKEIVNYSKILTYTQGLNEFYIEMQDKIDEYGIEEEEVEKRLEDYGLDL